MLSYWKDELLDFYKYFANCFIYDIKTNNFCNNGGENRELTLKQENGSQIAGAGRSTTSMFGGGDKRISVILGLSVVVGI